MDPSYGMEVVQSKIYNIVKRNKMKVPLEASISGQVNWIARCIKMLNISPC